MKKNILTSLFAIALCLCLAAPAFASPVYDFAYASTPICDFSQAYLNNLQLAADAIDGCSLYYGESFSFNDAVGPRDQQNGYRIALNGRGARVRGGGVSQVASTLNLAAMDFDGIVIEDFYAYGEKFVGGYVEDGELAVVTDYTNDHDYTITSWYPGTITISAWVEDDMVCCTFDGVEDEDFDISSYYGYYGYDDYPYGTIIGYDSTPLPYRENQLNNIRLASESINGQWLEYGDVFSFNDTVGPRAKYAGYVSALNGRGVSVVGGGVAQVASTVYLAAKYVDCITVDRVSTYGDRFTGGYVDDTADAVITDYNAGTDLSFTYYGDGSLQIVLYEEDGWLCCELIEY